jgi:hypothetical protein
MKNYQLISGRIINLNQYVALVIEEPKKKPPRLVIEMSNGDAYVLAEGEAITQEQEKVWRAIQFKP